MPKTTPENAYDAFRKDPSPALAVKLAIANFTAQHGFCADTEYTDQLRKAAAILTAFEEHRFTLNSALNIAIESFERAAMVNGGGHSHETFDDAKRAFVEAVAA